MQKKLIALAVAAALAPAAAMADTTLYGRVHVSVDNVTGITGANHEWFVNSNSSRLGVKGSEDLGNGLKGLYQLETGVRAVGTQNDGNPPNNTNNIFSGMRTSYLGLAGDFGTFLVGRLPAGEQYVYDSNLFADQVGDAANILSGGTAGYIGGRADGALHYISPSFNGFDVALTAVPGSSIGPLAKASYGVRANYAAMGAEVHVTYFDVKTNATTRLKPLSIAGSYDFGPGMVTAQFVRNSLTIGSNTTTQDMFNIGGKYKVMPNAAIKLQYTLANDDSDNTNGDNGGSQIAVGFDYDLSKRTSVYAAYAQVTNNAKAAFKPNNYGHAYNVNVDPSNDDDPKVFSVGFTHNF